MGFHFAKRSKIHESSLVVMKGGGLFLYFLSWLCCFFWLASLFAMIHIRQCCVFSLSPSAHLVLLLVQIICCELRFERIILQQAIWITSTNTRSLQIFIVFSILPSFFSFHSSCFSSLLFASPPISTTRLRLNWQVFALHCYSATL